MLRFARSAAATVFVLSLLAACGTNTTTTTTTASPQGSSRPSASAAGVSVDMTISGDRTATLKGNTGQCGHGGGALSIVLSGADYPDLGTSGVFSLTGRASSNGTVVSEWKLILGTAGFLSGADPGVTISADGKMLTLDADATGGPNTGTPVHIHLAGTITCA